ncbi:MAG: phosphoribosylamine--glycine ligase [Alphaproteobacteria bacterium]
MKVLVVGGGGREHALAWKIAQSPLVETVYCAPGNAGTAGCATNVPIGADDLNALINFAIQEKIGLTIVGPEAPLVAGLVDRLAEKGIKAFGPSAAAAQLEGSKAFCKEVMVMAGVPTAKYGAFTDAGAAKRYAREMDAPLVVKADGLAAGKGVLICQTIEEAEFSIDQIMTQKAFGEAGNKVVVEEFLTGEEASFLAFTDGEHVLPLVSSQDHKRIGDGDTGLNTGGMGAYSPAPVVTPDVHDKIMNQVMIPTVKTMAERGALYKGVLYAGLMIENGEPKVLEFNARFGDPETQPLLYRMNSDIVPLLLATVDGGLDQHTIKWDDRPSVCIVVASGGYPGSYEKGKVIEGLDAETPDAFVFHAGTKLVDGQAVTSGGRVLGVTAKGQDIPAAIENAYAAVKKVSFEKAYYRTDIGKKALKWLE